MCMVVVHLRRLYPCSHHGYSCRTFLFSFLKTIISLSPNECNHKSKIILKCYLSRLVSLPEKPKLCTVNATDDAQLLMGGHITQYSSTLKD